MHRLAERHAVQRVGGRPGRQHADHAVGQPAYYRVEDVGLFDPLGQRGRPADPAGLAVLGRPAGGGEGLPHDYGLPARPASYPWPLPSPRIWAS